MLNSVGYLIATQRTKILESLGVHPQIGIDMIKRNVFTYYHVNFVIWWESFTG